ncbi:hypothetical protein [Amycolatopsis pittospori]|uniref:hypothetical protein n=1 Tax=Amycolatopsis pittospori TaxID=2749434 RepID=UPI001F3546C1|nr:hypothetical protein [Amycolatopsis pittospori]
MTIRPDVPGMPGEDGGMSPACDRRHTIEESGENPYAPPVAGGLQRAAREEGGRLLDWLTATEGRMWRFIVLVAFAVTMVFVGIGFSNVEIDVTPGSVRIAPVGSAQVAPVLGALE